MEQIKRFIVINSEDKMNFWCISIDLVCCQDMFGHKIQVILVINLRYHSKVVICGFSIKTFYTCLVNSNTIHRRKGSAEQASSFLFKSVWLAYIIPITNLKVYHWSVIFSLSTKSTQIRSYSHVKLTLSSLKAWSFPWTWKYCHQLPSSHMMSWWPSSPPDQTGVLHTGAAHGPLAQGGAVGDGPQRLPGHVRPLRGGEHRPRVTIPDQPVN